MGHHLLGLGISIEEYLWATGSSPRSHLEGFPIYLGTRTVGIAKAGSSVS